MSLKGVMVIVAALGTACLVAATTLSEAAAQEIDRIELEELKGMLGSSGLLIVDVRTAKDWESSDAKIKGAVREDPKQVNERVSKYPKDKTIVFYCA
jgi:rhodanese-related sulfurtransferase